MENYVTSDRKQVFGAEQLDDGYMLKIKRLFEERMKEITSKGKDNSVTMPLRLWVN